MQEEMFPLGSNGLNKLLFVIWMYNCNKKQIPWFPWNNTLCSVAIDIFLRLLCFKKLC